MFYQALPSLSFFRLLLPLAVLMLCTASLAVAAELPPFPGKISQWHGYQRNDFSIEGKSVLVVSPKEAAPGRPWVWHGEFFGHMPAPDIELLGRGFHIVYLSVPNMLGSPKAVEHWNHCYRKLTDKYQLADKVALVGLSRGGLYCYNWAIANPQKVACIYGDAPVTDFKSWPGGKGEGKGSAGEWKRLMSEYGFANEAEALAYEKNPVDQLKVLAEAKVPLLHVYGTADRVVPWKENTGLLTERYEALGGQIKLIAKPGVGHHPHGLKDSTPIVEFIVEHASVPEVQASCNEPAETQRLRVLSYNIHHGEGIDGRLDLERIAKVILCVKPDLVALQEVDVKTQRTGQVDQAAALAKLTSMKGVFGDNISFEGGLYGNAVLSQYEIVRHENHALPNLDQGEQRGMLEVEVEVGGESLVLLATHLDHRPTDEERFQSAVAINQLAAKHMLPMLLAGDLNDVPTSRTLKVLGKQWTRANDQVAATVPVTEPTRQIDYVLYRPATRWKVIETRVLEQAVASDHRAVLAVLELGASR